MTKLLSNRLLFLSVNHEISFRSYSAKSKVESHHRVICKFDEHISNSFHSETGFKGLLCAKNCVKLFRLKRNMTYSSLSDYKVPWHKKSFWCIELPFKGFYFLLGTGPENKAYCEQENGGVLLKILLITNNQ